MENTQETRYCIDCASHYMYGIVAKCNNQSCLHPVDKSTIDCLTLRNDAHRYGFCGSDARHWVKKHTHPKKHVLHLTLQLNSDKRY